MCSGEEDGFDEAYGPDDNPQPMPEDQRLPAPHEAPGVHHKDEPVAPTANGQHQSRVKIISITSVASHSLSLNLSSTILTRTQSFSPMLMLFPDAPHDVIEHLPDDLNINESCHKGSSGS